MTAIGFPHEVTKARLPAIGKAVFDAAQEAGRALRQLKRS
jgi:hypothetical protein